MLTPSEHVRRLAFERVEEESSTTLSDEFYEEYFQYIEDIVVSLGIACLSFEPRASIMSMTSKQLKRFSKAVVAYSPLTEKDA